jgi:hypothetical protein
MLPIMQSEISRPLRHAVLSTVLDVGGFSVETVTTLALRTASAATIVAVYESASVIMRTRNKSTTPVLKDYLLACRMCGVPGPGQMEPDETDTYGRTLEQLRIHLIRAMQTIDAPTIVHALQSASAGKLVAVYDDAVLVASLLGRDTLTQNDHMCAWRMNNIS